mmetsp:Transcript_29114/g.82065  ORF Transcript_29114/g.82065 Transcript_29114/m.82065 type:complete len:363 (+) Transcript_29114:1636-2724(+)
MYFRNLTSLSVNGLSALITNRTRSARGMYSSVRRCCLCSTTLVPGVSTMLISLRRSAGRYRWNMPSASCSVRSSLLPDHLRMLISFVVGRMPSARNFFPSRALIKLDLPLLNSPTTTSRNCSSKFFMASSSKSTSAMPGLTSLRRSRTLCRTVFSSAIISSRAPPISFRRPEAASDWSAAAAAPLPGGAGAAPSVESLPSMARTRARAALSGLTALAQASRRSKVTKKPLKSGDDNNVPAASWTCAGSASDSAASTGMLPAFCCFAAAERFSVDGHTSSGDPSSKMKLAPCSAAATAPSVVDTMEPIRLLAPDKDRLATAIGTPFEERSTPSTPAASAISVLSCTRRTARPRRASLRRHAAS